jgi:4-hydroxybenzoate polyprenyltransferase
MDAIRPAFTSTLKGFFGLSRMTHSILDVAHPAIGAILVLGGFPRPSTVAIGLLAAFAGFTAVFALNDVMDCKVDCEKISKDGTSRECFDLDSVGSRHPIAQGSLALKAALGWVIGWGLCAIALAYVLSPLCAALVLAAAGLEIGYCRLLRVTHWKAFLSGLMVSVGGLAGVYAVRSSPSLPFVALFVLWAFAWEVGCRNIPNDWADLDEDINLKIRTIPVRYGRRVASFISFALLCLTVASSILFPYVVTVRNHLLYQVGALAVGFVFLVLPALRWVKTQQTESAMAFFNRACFYPLAVCALVGLTTVI